MDHDKVRSLLKKYFEGETELSEEKFLKDFFTTTSELPGDLKIYRDLFSYFKGQENVAVVNEDLTEKLKRTWEADQTTPVRKIEFWKQLLKYAAVLIPLVIVGYFFLNRKHQQEIAIQTDTFQDPQKAIAETEKALLVMSRNLSDGMAKIETFKLFEEIKNSEKFKEQNKSLQKNKP